MLDFRITPNREVGWIEARILVSYDGRRAVRMVGAIIDITERKKADRFWPSAMRSSTLHTGPRA